MTGSLVRHGDVVATLAGRDLATIEMVLALAVAALAGIALYDRWPRWR